MTANKEEGGGVGVTKNITEPYEVNVLVSQPKSFQLPSSSNRSNFPPPSQITINPFIHENTNTFLMNFYFSSCFGGVTSKGWRK